MRQLDFSIDLILPAATMTLGSTQSLAEISTKNILGDKGRPARKTGKLAAISELIV
jgi:hypothetical protein